MIDPAVIEALKIFSHFFLAALGVYLLRKMGLKPLTSFVIIFCFISLKEVADLRVINFIEYDDLVLNLAGSVFGASA